MPIAPPRCDACQPSDKTASEIPGARIRDVFDGYGKELNKAGKGKNSELRWAPVIENLVAFLGHDRADRLSRQDVIRWKDHLLVSFSAKTVRDTCISAARAAFRWGLDNEEVALNPFSSVKVIVGKSTRGREKGFNDEEALAVVRAASSYVAPSPREQPPMVAAKRWTPLLAAYTGARITELTSYAWKTSRIRVWREWSARRSLLTHG